MMIVLALVLVGIVALVLIGGNLRKADDFEPPERETYPVQEL